MSATTPVEEAEKLLRRVALFRSMGFDELDAQALARSEATWNAVSVLVKKGCPLELVARILS